MVTWGEVKHWQPGPLQNAVGPLSTAYNGVVACSDDLRRINTPYGRRRQRGGERGQQDH